MRSANWCTLSCSERKVSPAKMSSILQDELTLLMVINSLLHAERILAHNFITYNVQTAEAISVGRICLLLHVPPSSRYGDSLLLSRKQCLQRVARNMIGF